MSCFLFFLHRICHKLISERCTILGRLFLLLFCFIFATCKKVEDVPVSYVKISKAVLQLVTGETTTLSAIIEPSNATNKLISWHSSNTGVVSVCCDGEITATGEGTAVIIVSSEDGGKIATCTITVSDNSEKTNLITGISLNVYELFLHPTDIVQLVATIDKSNTFFEWSSNKPDVAKVSHDGIVTAISEGMTAITVKSECGSKSTVCVVTVSIPDVAYTNVSSVTLCNSDLFLSPGSNATLSAAIEPSNASDRVIFWFSSDPAVATVSNNGEVIAISEGTATIVVTSKCGGKSAACIVTVSLFIDGYVSVYSVSLSNMELSLAPGDNITLTATIEPPEASDNTIFWSSNNPAIATVSDVGLITAVSEGTTAIIATSRCGSKSAACVVNVIPVTSVSIIPSEITLFSGDNTMLLAIVEPSNASEKTVYWSSNNPAVAIVDVDGIVTAISEGKADIVATSKCGEISAICAVTVSLPAEPLTITIEFVVNIAGFLYLGISSLSQYTVNWGNGDIQSYEEGERNHYYTSYSNFISEMITVTVTGNLVSFGVANNNDVRSINITQNSTLSELRISRNPIENIDVSGCLGLKLLEVSVCDLKSLDLSKNLLLRTLLCEHNSLNNLCLKNNTQLELVRVNSNDFDSSALNKLFYSLHENPHPYYYFTKNILVSNNPGSSACDPSIATKKGWIVH